MAHSEGILPLRSCGNCTACCKTHAVLEVPKRVNEWCIHCKKGKGCMIQAQKPTTCSEFYCQWAYQHFHISDRPDKSGVVVDYQEHELRGQKIPFFMLWEVNDSDLSRRFALKASAKFKADAISVLVLPVNRKPSLYLVDAVYNALSEKKFMIDDGRDVDVFPLSALPKRL